jgi:glycosyltransferase involved in cell wall biosynthesis
MNDPRINSISAFFPAYNDAESIGQLVSGVHEVLDRLTPDFEIIVVNDGSTDSTAQRLIELQERFPRLRVVTHETNRGYGGALRSGFAAASKDLIFYTDGDGQYDVGELPALLAEMGEGVDVVNGFKKNRADGIHRKLLGKAYGTMVRSLFRLPVRDVDCDFRLIRRERMQEFDLQIDSGAICVELVKKLSATGSIFAEVAVNHYPRIAGRSQFLRFGRVVRTFKDLARLWVKTCLLKNRRVQNEISMPAA